MAMFDGPPTMVEERCIPCTLMRGGTSRGPFFLAANLPRDPRERDLVLVSAMGAGHELQIDGIGGGNPLTSKVAIVGPATRADASVDYLFAQVKVTERMVDTSPNCGNMLAAVGPFAIEQGLVRASRDTTLVRIHNVNTGKIISARVQTPQGQVCYGGDAAIDGVPGTAAPVYLAFADAAGAKTGKLFPTGARSERIGGIEITCIDAAMPLVIVNASDLGKSGQEPAAELDADGSLLACLEELRVEAGRRMGFANAAQLVIPKPVLIGPPRRDGTIAARYFMPWSCHKAFAITGAVGLATACVEIDTVAERIAGPLHMPGTLIIEHPSGRLDVRMERSVDGSPVASVMRTARRLFEGTVFARLPIAAPDGPILPTL